MNGVCPLQPSHPHFRVMNRSHTLPGSMDRIVPTVITNTTPLTNGLLDDPECSNT